MSATLLVSYLLVDPAVRNHAKSMETNLPGTWMVGNGLSSRFDEKFIKIRIYERRQNRVLGA